MWGRKRVAHFGWDARPELSAGARYAHENGDRYYFAYLAFMWESKCNILSLRCTSAIMVSPPRLLISLCIQPLSSPLFSYLNVHPDSSPPPPLPTLVPRCVHSSLLIQPAFTFFEGGYQRMEKKGVGCPEYKSLHVHSACACISFCVR